MSEREYTAKEISEHTVRDISVWIIVAGFVYNVTDFVDEHPGGAEEILHNAGKDVTSEFMRIHSETAKQMLKQYKIGKLKK
ncbi:nitrate reductase-like [NADH] [Dinothrombium tinctorium]|uniref:Nitrate reductase-like [NADH] n=1 Tax=Dinothrombium tinctorium TaxID=1965070 RepID=A0A443QDD9_9ACAR|nr:nitrate reductase-like [NADH] [Dinothrombium tinctorium]